MRGFCVGGKDKAKKHYADGGEVKKQEKPKEKTPEKPYVTKILGFGMAKGAGQAIAGRAKQLAELEAQNYADGGEVMKKPKMPEVPAPKILGSGMAAGAAKLLGNRGRKLEDAIDGYANGGIIQGKGTGISDDIDMLAENGSYIMPADSTQKIGAKNLGAMGFEVGQKIKVSNGEYGIPPEQVHAIGVETLDKIKNGTHTPANKQKEKPYFADGGAVGFYVDKDGRASKKLGPLSKELDIYQPKKSSLPANSMRTIGDQPRVGFTPQSAPSMPSGAQFALPPSTDKQNYNPKITEPDYQARAIAKQQRAIDMQAFNAERAAQDAKFANAGNAAASAPTAKGFKPTVGRSLGAVGAGLAAYGEGRDVARVAADPSKSKIDVATQATEGVGRLSAASAGGLAGAKAGYSLGQQAGPYARIASPVLAAAGGIGGAIAGGFGANTAIKAGRAITGSNTSSPVDSINQEFAGGTSNGAAAQQPTFDESGNPVWAENSQDSQLLQQPVDSSNNVTRVGNSYSGGNITEGFTINGEAPSRGGFMVVPEGVIGSGTGFNSAQNTKMPQAGGFRTRILRDTSKPLSSDDIVRSRLDAQSRAADAKMQDVQNRAAYQSSQLANQNARLQMEQQKFAGDIEEQDYRLGAQRRANELRQAYDLAKTPEEQALIARQMQQLSGQQQSNQNLRNNFMTRSVPVLDDNGQPTGYMQDEIVDLRQFATQDTQPKKDKSGPKPTAANIAALKNNPALADMFEAKFPDYSAADYIGKQ